MVLASDFPQLIRVIAMSFFGRIRDALFGRPPEVKAPAEPASKTEAAEAPKEPTKTGYDVAFDRDEQAHAAPEPRQDAPASSATPRRAGGRTSPTADLYAAAVEMHGLTGKADMSSEEFVQLAEEQIKVLQGDATAIEQMVGEHAVRVESLVSAHGKSLEALTTELLPNLDQATWDKLVKLTGFNMKNPPIGDRSPEALARVRKELGLFIAHSDRFTLGPKIERDKRAGDLYRAVDALASKIGYLNELAEQFTKAKLPIGKQIGDIKRHIEAAKANPQKRITRREAEEKLARAQSQQRRELVGILRRAYEICFTYTAYLKGPAYSGLPWFWWYVFTGANYDRTFRPREVADYMRNHPEYKPPVPRPPRPPSPTPPPEEPGEPYPDPTPWPVPWPYPTPWPWPDPTPPQPRPPES